MDLATKYRPDNWNKVLGQKQTVASLRRLVDEREKHAFCITGPSGTGKTTLARICAHKLGARNQDIQEIDAASYTGIDAWRDIRAQLRYAPMGASKGARCIIVDEAHRLSKNAWDSLLKDVEEPPDHVFWFFCTTEPGKVPKAIVNRCASFALRVVSGDDLFDRLVEICEAEGYDTSDDVLDLIVREAQGSPRQAIAFLEVCRECKTRDEASDLVQAVASQREPIELARGLVANTLAWKDCVRIVAGLQDTTPAESLRRIIVAYVSAVLMKQTTEAKAAPLLAVLTVMRTPFPSDAKAAELLLPLGELIIE